MIQRRYTDRLILAVIPLVIGFIGSARADVFQAVDAQGVVHLTNIPSNTDYKILIHTATNTPMAGDHQAATPPLQTAKVKSYAKVLKKAAREQNLDRALLQAIIAVESNFDPQAVSSRGAVGLMQLMPATAQRYGVTDRYDPEENIQGGARYLRDLLQRYNDNLPLVLAAYNAGEDAVDRYGNRIPPYAETRRYVPQVMSLYRHYRMNQP
ncbi:MAG: transglycosylase SLT domain-containing protein [Gammaproteobacteria bacterium]|nr:transglycosylase SLT domain-containing protein [Gammaproteobacteria bacterium]